MRSESDNNKIIKSYSDPVIIKDALGVDDIFELIDIFETSNKTTKNTGPITVNISQDNINAVAIQKILTISKKYIGNFDISAGLFFKVEFPHIVHNDDTWSFPQAYKAITIPLKLYGEGRGFPGLCVFDQYYLDGPAKFFNSELPMELNYNKGVYEYSDVYNKSDTPIPDSTYLNYLTHIKRKWLEGLSVNQVLEWKPGNIMIFDSTKLHCATDFRRLGYTGKLGLSIFTKL